MNRIAFYKKCALAWVSLLGVVIILFCGLAALRWGGVGAYISRLVKRETLSVICRGFILLLDALYVAVVFHLERRTWGERLAGKKLLRKRKENSHPALRIVLFFILILLFNSWFTDAIAIALLYDQLLPREKRPYLVLWTVLVPILVILVTFSLSDSIATEILREQLGTVHLGNLYDPMRRMVKQYIVSGELLLFSGIAAAVTARNVVKIHEEPETAQGGVLMRGSKGRRSPVKRAVGMLLLSGLLLLFAMGYMDCRSRLIPVEPEAFAARTFDFNGEDRTMETLLEMLEGLKWSVTGDSGEETVKYRAELDQASEEQLVPFLIEPASLVQVTRIVGSGDDEESFLIHYDETSGLSVILGIINGKVSLKAALDSGCPQIDAVYIYDYRREKFSSVWKPAWRRQAGEFMIQKLSSLAEQQ
ncbi:MAG: hypothetical protein PUC36_07425 [Clostridiales bacterium]|nr:hypothetical protein [Clostridiales bacterium]